MVQHNHRPWNKDRQVGEREPFTPPEAWQILQHLKSHEKWHDAAALTLGIDSLLRCSDLLKLRVRDVVDRSGRVAEVIKLRQTKVRRGVAPALTKTARDACHRWIEFSGKGPDDYLFTRDRNAHDDPITDGWFREIVKGWAKAIGLDPTAYSSHSLRRTKPHFMYRRGVDIAYISTLLGHKDTSTTLVYLGIKDAEAQHYALKHDVWNQSQHSKAKQGVRPHSQRAMRVQDFQVFEVGQSEVLQRLDQTDQSIQNLTAEVRALSDQNRALTACIQELLSISSKLNCGED